MNDQKEEVKEVKKGYVTMGMVRKGQTFKPYEPKAINNEEEKAKAKKAPTKEK